MEIKLFDSELKVMDVLWKQGDAPAREIARVLTDELGWNVNTTYTLIKRCMKKGAIERSEPGFFCHALIPKSAVQEAETDELINKVYDGSADKLFAALLGRKKLSDEQIEQLRQMFGLLEGGAWVGAFDAEPCGRRDDRVHHVALGDDYQQRGKIDVSAALGCGAAAAAGAIFAALAPECLFAAGAE